MIGTLIDELANDKINLSQALTRAKLIQAKLKVEELKVWLTSELTGYGDDADVPEYRKLRMQLVGDFAGPFGAYQKNSPLMLQHLEKDLGIDMHQWTERGGIKNIETHVEQSAPGSVIAISFAEIVPTLSELYQRQNSSFRLVSVSGLIAPGQYVSILEQTKQRLLDLLLELQDKFPDFDKKYTPTAENQEQARSIVNYNIYGGTNTSNLAVGDNVIQSNSKQFTKTTHTGFEDLLKNAGVPESEIPAIRAVVISNENKQTKLSKAMKWIGQLSSKMIEKGVEIKMPELIETIQGWIEKSQ